MWGLWVGGFWGGGTRPTRPSRTEKEGPHPTYTNSPTVICLMTAKTHLAAQAHCILLLVAEARHPLACHYRFPSGWVQDVHQSAGTMESLVAGGEIFPQPKHRGRGGGQPPTQFPPVHQRRGKKFLGPYHALCYRPPPREKTASNFFSVRGWDGA